MKRRKKRNTRLCTTGLIGAVVLTMKQLGFCEDDIDLTVFGIVRIRQRFSPEAVQEAGISWIARMLPEALFHERWDNGMEDMPQDLANDFKNRIMNKDGGKNR